MAIIGIVAIAKNYAIGKGGKLPWHYSADLKFFKRMTVGNAVVMGSATWLSLGKPLPERLNIILSRSIEAPPGTIVLRTKAEILELARHLHTDVFIIGGARTFELFAADIEQWIVTQVPIEVEDADAFMPRNFLDGFEEHGSDELEPGLIAKQFRRTTLSHVG